MNLWIVRVSIYLTHLLCCAMTESELNEFNPELIHLYVNDDTEEGDVTPLVAAFKSFDEFYCNKCFFAAGGMKVIYKIQDLRTNRFVAMAELKDGCEGPVLKSEQFLREARIAAALEHPNILPVYDIGLHDDGAPFFTMKLMKGVSLDQILREKGTLNRACQHTFDRAALLEVFVKVCEAVAYAHSCRVIHLDIKPANIMIGDYGEVYVCDWGIARVLDRSMVECQEIVTLDEGILNDITLSGVVKGTPGFMAPEQVDKRFGRKCEQTDIYALGALLYAMLAGRRPLAGLSSEAVISATVSGQVPPLKSVSEQVPDSLNAICVKSMAVEQECRYGSVKALLADLRAYQEGFATQAENASAFKLLCLLLKRNRWFFIMMLMIIITGVIVGGISGSFLMKNKLEAQKQIATIKEVAGELEKMLDEEKNKFLVDRKRMSRAEAVRGKAIVLNGKTQFVRNDEIPFRVGTVAFWFKPSRTDDLYPKFFQVGRFCWHINSASRRNNGGLISISGKSSIPPAFLGGALWDKWHHFAMTVSKGGETVFYVDGIEIELKITYSGEKGVSLGHWLSAGIEFPLKSSFDELSVWNRILSREEIMDVANHTLKGSEKGLVGYYNFDGNIRNKVSDNYHLKAVGGLRFSN